MRGMTCTGRKNRAAIAHILLSTSLGRHMRIVRCMRRSGATSQWGALCPKATNPSQLLGQQPTWCIPPQCTRGDPPAVVSGSHVDRPPAGLNLPACPLASRFLACVQPQAFSL
eukprot:1094889-Pelagomonas_calceolata.AAC.12